MRYYIAKQDDNLWSTEVFADDDEYFTAIVEAIRKYGNAMYTKGIRDGAQEQTEELDRIKNTLYELLGE